MSDDKPQKTDRYRDTVFLPKTAFAMKAGLPQREPELLKRWEEMDLYKSSASSRRPPEIRAARRPALCQRQPPHRPCAQQDPEGHRHPLAPDAGL